MTPVSLRDMFHVFGRIGLLSFGGPAAQIALMHRILVEEKNWLDEDGFLRALSLCMLLPGPEAMQLATYAGWRLRGTLGGVIAGLLFVGPGALLIAGLAIGYASYGQVPLVQAAFFGIKAAVIVIVLQALLKVARKALHGQSAWGLAAFAFVSLFMLGLPFPLIVALAGVYGAVFLSKSEVPSPTTALDRASPFATLAIWGGLWLAPVALIWGLDQTFLLQIALFFSKLAVVTFGGAYAVLAYMTQTVVQDFGWITTAEMIDALGLAETTPGPLILVTQFVAMLAGYQHGGIGLALVAGVVSLWVTFVPCFLWIFLAGPHLETIARTPRLAAALKAITAAVVGVILNLALWFALHVLFKEIGTVPGLAMPRPVLETLDVAALALTALAAVFLLVVKLPMVPVLGLMALAGLGVSLI